MDNINNTLSRLMTNIDNLDKRLTILDNNLQNIKQSLTIIENTLTSKPFKNTTVENKDSKEEKKFFNKDTDGLQSLLRQNLDEWSKNFVLSIINSEHQTVTDKQLQKLTEIAQKVNYTGSLVF